MENGALPPYQAPALLSSQTVCLPFVNSEPGSLGDTSEAVSTDAFLGHPHLSSLPLGKDVSIPVLKGLILLPKRDTFFSSEDLVLAIYTIYHG